MVGFTEASRAAATSARSKNAQLRKDARIKEYELNPRKCENKKCENHLSFLQSRDKSVKFCCRACSNSSVKRINSTESREKVSKALIGKSSDKIVNKNCAICSAPFKLKFGHRNIKTCSVKCGKKLGGINSARTKTLNGTHPGWQARTREPSYPEKYFISLFEKERISGWAREKKVGKWFIDFSFESKKIAVEIDGRQHEEIERKESDKIKDAFLIENGWTVCRIKWFNPINERNKNLLYPQIEALKIILNVSEQQSSRFV